MREKSWSFGLVNFPDLLPIMHDALLATTYRLVTNFFLDHIILS